MVEATRDYTHVLSLLFNTPWAILPEKLQAMTELLQLRLQGVTFTAEEIRARVGEAAQGGAMPMMSGSVAVLPLRGVISQRANMITQSSGGTSAEAFGKAFKGAIESDSVKAVVLDIDSPGGSVHGTAELADLIFEARGRKPIVAVANSQGASGAYFIGSQADEFVSIPTGLVGSIGVFTEHVDRSRAEEMAGLKTTLIYAGKFKVEGNTHEPLSTAGRQHAQELADSFYEMFVGAVARGRNVTAEAVRNGFGQGRMLGSKAALAAGMIDRIATLEEVVTQLGGGQEANESGQVSARREAEGTREVHVDEKKIRAALGIDEGGDIMGAITTLRAGDEKAVRAALAIDEGADIVEAITTLKAEAENGAKGAGTGEEVTKLQKDLSEAQRSILTLQGENASAKAERQVDDAIQAGRLLPKQKEVALKMALRDPKEFDDFLATQPKGLVKLGEIGSSGDFMAADGSAVNVSDLEPSAQEITVATQMGVWGPEHRITMMRQKAAAQGIELPADFGKTEDDKGNAAGKGD